MNDRNKIHLRTYFQQQITLFRLVMFAAISSIFIHVRVITNWVRKYIEYLILPAIATPSYGRKFNVQCFAASVFIQQKQRTSICEWTNKYYKRTSFILHVFVALILFVCFRHLIYNAHKQTNRIKMRKKTTKNKRKIVLFPFSSIVP